MPVTRDPQRPFERDAFFDEPGIVGARWWNRAFDAEVEASRRQAMKALSAVAVVLGGIVAIGVAGAAAAVANAPVPEWRKSLDVQRRIGWSVGAFDEPITWAWPLQGISPGRATLDALKETLRAKRHAAFEVLTRLEALGAVPTDRIADETYVVTDFRDAARIGKTSTMEADFRAGQTFARIFAGKETSALVIVDCGGVRSVAFAAGACGTFEPVLVLDNWPHPKGVVGAHNTVGALGAYLPEFQKGVAARGATPPPMLVLEHERTDPLIDPADRFDNRYFVTLPTTDTLKRWGFSRVLLVVENEAALPESGDVSVWLSDYAAAGIDCRLFLLTTFDWDGQYPGGDGGFFHHYPWGPAVGAAPPPLSPVALAWRPGARAPLVTPRAPPEHFGQTQVYTRKGVLVGVPAYGGSRDRSGGGYGG